MLLLTSCLPKKFAKEVGYQPLKCITSSGQGEAVKMMENTIGLENGKCYKFRNRMDNTVIEFKLGSSNQMITGDEVSSSGENSHQVFEAEEEDSGQFRIACRYQSADTQHFWDYLPHRKQLIHKKRSTAESSLQLWASECVPGMDTAFFILSVQNGMCLKSNGRNRQVSITKKNTDDYSQHWRLEVQPY